MPGKSPTDLRIELGNLALNRRRFLARMGLSGLVLSGAGGLLSACSDSSTQNARGVETLTVAFSDSFPSMDIVHAFVGNVATMMLLTQEPLVTYDNDLKLVPHLASSWSQPEANKFVFKIRQGVKFWDGSPLTQADVLYSVRRNLDPDFASQVAGYLSNVKSVDPVGQHAVAITVHNPDETLPYILTLLPTVKESVAKPEGRHYGEPGTPVMGTGPYSVESFSPETGMTLKRYDSYWGEKPIPHTVEVRIIPDEIDRQLAMRSGDVMMSYDVSENQAEQWEALPNAKVLTGDPLESTILSFDMSQEPWDDIHVRRCFAHVWNPQFANTVLGSGAEAATAPVPKAMWASLLEPAAVNELYDSLAEYPYDLDQARVELDRSSHSEGFDVELKVPNDSPALQKAALSLQENLEEVGITLTVSQQVGHAWTAYQQAHEDLGLQLHVFGPDYPDPSDYLQFLTSASAKPNGWNLANYRNPKFDDLHRRQVAERDPKKRATLMGKMLTMAQADLPFLGLWWSAFPIAYRTDLMTYTHMTSLCYLQSWTKNVSAP